jgi:hypothetical protein
MLLEWLWGFKDPLQHRVTHARIINEVNSIRMTGPRGTKSGGTCGLAPSETLYSIHPSSCRTLCGGKSVPRRWDFNFCSFIYVSLYTSGAFAMKGRKKSQLFSSYLSACPTVRMKQFRYSWMDLTELFIPGTSIKIRQQERTFCMNAYACFSMYIDNVSLVTHEIFIGP